MTTFCLSGEEGKNEGCKAEKGLPREEREAQKKKYKHEEKNITF